MDLLLKENFDLKREIVFERKKYVDLQQAYQDLRETVNEGNDEGSPDKRQSRQSLPVHMERLSAKSSASQFNMDPQQLYNMWKLEKNQMQ